MSAYGTGMGFNTQSQPDFIDLNNPLLQRQNAMEFSQQGTSLNINIYDPNNLPPLHILAGHIGFYQAMAGRPTLAPLVRLREANNPYNPDETSYQKFYNNLFDRLPESLKTKLTDDMKKTWSDRDPDLIAFEESLKFEANLLSNLENFGKATLPSDSIHLNSAIYQNLSNQISQSNAEFGTLVKNHLNEYLNNTLGRNDPNYDSLSNILNQIDQITNDLKTSSNKSPQKDP